MSGQDAVAAAGLSEAALSISAKAAHFWKVAKAVVVE